MARAAVPAARKGKAKRPSASQNGKRDLVVTYEDPTSLLPDRDNPRKITPAKRARLKRGIEKFGLTQPLVVRGETSIVIGGHQRLDIAKELGLAVVPVTRLWGLTNSEARALGILYNNQEAQGEWETDSLANVLRALQKDGFDLADTGFGESDLAKLLRDLDGGGAGSEDDADLTVPSQPKSQPGTAYMLGDHVLLCGDATAPNAWAMLGGARASMLWTDPPYGVSYGEKNARLNRADKKARRASPSRIETPIESDSGDEIAIAELLRVVFRLALAHTTPGAAWYVTAPAGPQSVPFAAALKEIGVLRQGLVWRKNNHVLGGADYHYIHELVLYGWSPGAGHYWCGSRSLTSVFDVDRPRKNGDHPTMKPVALVAQCIENSSKEGWLVVDPFAGSGTTLVACERLQRRAALIEIDPGYCDVIRRRYSELVNDPKLAP